jgi:hypothetical protein
MPVAQHTSFPLKGRLFHRLKSDAGKQAHDKIKGPIGEWKCERVGGNFRRTCSLQMNRLAIQGNDVCIRIPLPDAFAHGSRRGSHIQNRKVIRRFNEFLQ